MVRSPDFSCRVIAVSVTLESLPVVLLEVISSTWIFCPGCSVLRFVHEYLSARAEDRHGSPNINKAMTSDRMMRLLHAPRERPTCKIDTWGPARHFSEGTPRGRGLS